MQNDISKNATLKSKKETYTLQSIRNIGSNCQIWRAQNSLGNTVAIKVYNKNPKNALSNTITSMAKEGHTMASLQHPSICKVLDFCISENHNALVMEYLDGLDLCELIEILKIKKLKIRVPLIIEIIFQVAEALDYAHNSNRFKNRHYTQGVLHRDIKPANIFITKQGEVKILDFGISDNPYTKNKIEDSGYTPIYTANDLWEDKIYQYKNYAPQHDIYSLALVFFELITNKKVFKNIYHVIQNDRASFETTHDISPELIKIIERAMHPNPKKRYGSASMFLAELKQFREAELDYKKELKKIILTLSKYATYNKCSAIETQCSTVDASEHVIQLNTILEIILLTHLMLKFPNHLTLLQLLKLKTSSFDIKFKNGQFDIESHLEQIKSTFNHYLDSSQIKIISTTLLKNEDKLRHFLKPISNSKSRNETYGNLKKLFDIHELSDDEQAGYLKKLRSILTINPLLHCQPSFLKKTNTPLIHAIFVNELQPNWNKLKKPYDLLLVEKNRIEEKYLRNYAFEKNEKDAIYYYLIHLACSDKRIHEKEKFFVKEFNSLFGSPEVRINAFRKLTKEEIFKLLPLDHRLEVLTMLIREAYCDNSIPQEEKDNILDFAMLAGKSKKKNLFSEIDLQYFFHYIFLNLDTFSRDKKTLEIILAKLNLSFEEIEKTFFATLPFLKLHRKYNINIKGNINSILCLFPAFKEKSVKYTSRQLYISKQQISDILFLKNLRNSKASILIKDINPTPYIQPDWNPKEEFYLTYSCITYILEYYARTGDLIITPSGDAFITDKQNETLCYIIYRLGPSKETKIQLIWALKKDLGITLKIFKL